MKPCPVCKKPMSERRKTCSKLCASKVQTFDFEMVEAREKNLFLKMPTPSQIAAKNAYEHNAAFVDKNINSMSSSECVVYAKEQNRLYKTFQGVA